MNLTQTLIQIARDFDLREDDLLRYAAEDTETGWDLGKGAWPIGSLWQVEGQILYALIRALKPKRLLELGTWHGCSATHMLLAMARNDNASTLLCIDNDKHQTGVIGAQIPARLRSNLTIHNSHISQWLQEQVETYDFVFSDGSHDSEHVAIIWQSRQKFLNPGGVIIEHDALHFGVGEQVMRGIHAADATPFTYLTEPSDCGLAIERVPQAEDIPKKDYSAMPYNDLWTETGPKILNMRKWIREQTGAKVKPKRPVLLQLIETWIASDGTVTHQLEIAQQDGAKRAERVKNGGK